MLLNNYCVNEEVKEEFKDMKTRSENEDATYQNSGCSKSTVSENFLAIQANLKKNFKQYSNLHIKKPEKEEQTKLRGSRRKEIIKIRSEINSNRDPKAAEKINETKC